MDSQSFINLERASILLVDGSNQGTDILTQIFSGFGARQLRKCATIKAAQELVQTTEIDLIVANDILADGDGYEFVRWLRRLDGNANTFTSVIIISGHTRRSVVGRTRDCGANFLVAKPISPQTMLERVLWVSREKRPFVETADYVGPDRRHHEAVGPENKGRRRNDKAAAEAKAAQAGDSAEEPTQGALSSDPAALQRIIA